MPGALRRAKIHVRSAQPAEVFELFAGATSGCLRIEYDASGHDYPCGIRASVVTSCQLVGAFAANKLAACPYDMPDLSSRLEKIPEPGGHLVPLLGEPFSERYIAPENPQV
jgi:hypothetical protein